MPPPFRPTSSNELLIPAFFATDENGPELLQWKREHPDWFVAGTWTPGRREPNGRGPAFGRNPPGRPVAASPGQRTPGVDYAAVAQSVPLLDPSTLSLADFKSTAAAARAERAAWPPETEDSSGNGSVARIQIQSGGPPRNARRPGGGGPPRTFSEELLQLRFNNALKELRRLEPNNRELTYVSNPNRAPSVE